MSDHFNLAEDELNIKLNSLKNILDSFLNLSKEKTESAMKDAMSLLAEIDKIVEIKLNQLNQMKFESTITSSSSDTISIKVTPKNKNIVKKL